MSFLDDTGLAYFYNKIKTKFISSVTAGTDENNLPVIHTPDENGNIMINNVETANNLKADDALITQDTFIYRTAGGTASIFSGDAELVYIDGNMSISGRIEENFQITSENNITVACSDNNTWRAQYSASGTYTFYYLAPNSSTAVSDSWTANGTWTHESIANISLSSYGLTATGIVNPSINLACNSSTITATIVPNTWMSYIETSGTFTFYYDEEDNIPKWLLDGETSVTLETYGITITGTPQVGDIIIVTYVKGTPNSTVSIVYTAPTRGRISIATPTSFLATGFNQFDKSSMYIQDANFNNGAIGANSGTYVCYCKAKGGVDNGYVAYSESGKILDIGWCDSIPIIGGGVVTTGAAVSSTLASIPFDTDGYVAVVVNGSSGMDDLCIHPKWSGDADTDFEEYSAPDTITLPTQDINGFTIPIGSYGMPAVGLVADRLNLEAGLYIKNIERIEYSASNLETVIGYNTPYEYDLTEYDAWDNITYQGYIYYVRTSPMSYTVEVDPTYTTSDYGTEEFIGTSVPVTAQCLYGQNLRDKLRTDVVTLSPFPEPVSDTKKANACNNIGAVNKAGDTMTGNLILSRTGNSSFTIQCSDGDTTAASRTAARYLYYRFYDKNDEYTGFLGCTLQTDGSNNTSIAARKKVNNSNIDNALTLSVNADGTRTVDFTNATPWRSALGLGTDGVFPLTIEQGGTGGTSKTTACNSLGAWNIGSQGISLSAGTNIDNLTSGQTYYSGSSSVTSSLGGTQPYSASGYKLICYRNYGISVYDYQFATGSNGHIKYRVKGADGWLAWNTFIHSASDSGILDVAHGGTGATTAVAAATALQTKAWKSSSNISSSQSRTLTFSGTTTLRYIVYAFSSLAASNGVYHITAAGSSGTPNVVGVPASSNLTFTASAGKIVVSSSNSTSSYLYIQCLTSDSYNNLTVT